MPVVHILCDLMNLRFPGSYSLTRAVMARECGGHRLQAPRHLLQDLHATADKTYAIESGRDFGSPPFSLDFAQARHAGILVRGPSYAVPHTRTCVLVAPTLCTCNALPPSARLQAPLEAS